MRPDSSTMNPDLEKPKRSHLERFKELIAEYGAVALVVHYVIFAVVISGFALGIRSGWMPSSGMGTAGTWGAAYIATKLTQPLRMIATVVLTPVIVRTWKHFAGARTTPE